MHETEGGTDDDPVLRRFQHVERLFIGKIAMIDAIDMIAHGALDRRRRARMGRDALVPLVGDLDCGRDLGLAHRCDLGPSVGDEFVARDVDLDVVDPFATAKAHRASDLVRAIGDHAEAFGVHVLLALVAQASGHRDFRSGRAIARASEIAVLDLLAHDHVETQLGRRRRVAGREPVIEDERRVAAGPEQMLLGRNLAEILIARRTDEGKMAMPLDHARHERHAAAVDDLGAVAANLPVAARDR